MSLPLMKTNSDDLFDEQLVKIRKEKARFTIQKAPYIVREFETYLKGIFDFVFEPLSGDKATSQKKILILGHAPEFSAYVRQKGVDITSIHPLINQNWFESCRQNDFDYVFDFMGFHWINDPLLYLSLIKLMLKKGGFYGCGFLGGTTLKEFRQVLIEADIDFFGGAFGRVSPMIKPEAATRLLQSAGFTDVVVDHEEVLVGYQSLKDLVMDLRHMGETNALSKEPQNGHYEDKQKKRLKSLGSSSFSVKAYLDCAESHYQKRFKTKTFQITYDLIYMSGWV